MSNESFSADDVRQAEEITARAEQKVLSQLVQLGVSAKFTDRAPFVDELDPPSRLIEIQGSPINFVRVNAFGTFDFWVQDPAITIDFPHVSVRTDIGTSAWDVRDPDNVMELPEEFFEDGLEKSFDLDFSQKIADKLNQHPQLNMLIGDAHIDVEAHLTSGYWILQPLLMTRYNSQVLMTAYSSQAEPSGSFSRFFQFPVDVARFLWWLATDRGKSRIFRPEWRDLESSDWETNQVLADALRAASSSEPRE